MGTKIISDHRSDTTPGVASAVGARSKIDRYGALVNTRRCRLVPFVAETWGRLEYFLEDFLLGAARVASYRARGRDRASTDDAEKRRDARVAASLLRGWRLRLSAGIARAVAEALDRSFYPLGGSVERQSYMARVPRGVHGGGAPGEGLLGRSGRVRNSAPFPSIFG
jgi:hypothetical protein